MPDTTTEYPMAPIRAPHDSPVLALALARVDEYRISQSHAYLRSVADLAKVAMDEQAETSRCAAAGICATLPGIEAFRPRSSNPGPRGDDYDAIERAYLARVERICESSSAEVLKQLATACRRLDRAQQAARGGER